MHPGPPVIDYALPPDRGEGPLPWWIKVAAALSFVIAAAALVQCLRDWHVNGPVMSGLMLGLILLVVVLEIGVVLYRSGLAAAILAGIWFLFPTCCLSPGLIYFAHNATRAEVGFGVLAIAIPLGIALCHVLFARRQTYHR